MGNCVSDFKTAKTESSVDNASKPRRRTARKQSNNQTVGKEKKIGFLHSFTSEQHLLPVGCVLTSSSPSDPPSVFGPLHLKQWSRRRKFCTPHYRRKRSLLCSQRKLRDNLCLPRQIRSSVTARTERNGVVLTYFRTNPVLQEFGSFSRTTVARNAVLKCSSARVLQVQDTLENKQK